MNKRTVLLGIAWALSIAITAWVTANWKPTHEVAPDLKTPESAASAPVPASEALAELEALRSEIAELKANETEMGMRYLSLSLEKWAENGGRVPVTEADAARMWENMNSAGSSTIEGEIRRFTQFVMLGDVGAGYLGKVINDPEKEQIERDGALEYLSLMCTPESYDALLKYRPEIFPDDGFPFDAFAGLVELLPTDQVRDGFPALLAQIRSSLDQNIGREPIDLLGEIAFIHGDGQARVMLGDRRLMSLNVSGLIQLAEQSGNSEARAFVESVAREHTDESMREQARIALDRLDSLGEGE